MTYIDTSVLAAYYCPEASSAEAEAAIRQADVPAISPLVEVELYSAVARKIRDGALSQEESNRVLARFQQHLELPTYHRLPIDALHYTLAREWIGRFSVPLRTLAALHLAISSSTGSVLLTADQALAHAAEHFGIRAQLLSTRNPKN